MGAGSVVTAAWNPGAFMGQPRAQDQDAAPGLGAGERAETFRKIRPAGGAVSKRRLSGRTLSDHPPPSLSHSCDQRREGTRPDLTGTRDIGDELVIGIDDRQPIQRPKSPAGSPRRSTPFPRRFSRARRPDALNAVECMLPYCNGDWLLRVDQDETLSAPGTIHLMFPACSRDRDVTSTGYLGAWRCLPAIATYRRAMVSGLSTAVVSEYSVVDPIQSTPHDRPRIAGEGAASSDSWILHWDPVWYTAHDETRRWNFIGSWATRKTNIILHDEQVFQTRPLDYVISRPSTHWREASIESSPFYASLELLDWPEVLQAGKLEPVLIDVRNSSNRMFRPSSTFVRPANV